jgi:hypothetical protein
MPTLRERQAAFAGALMDPVLPLPAGILGRHGESDARRFAVYRNNVVVGLVEALASRFPVVQRLVGEDFFFAMARCYAVETRPASPLMMEYGGSFPNFIAGFRPAAEVPYLADVARLERAWGEAFHAAEAVPIAISVLPQVGLGGMAFELHPSARLVRSLHPVGTIWAAHQGEEEPRPPEAWTPEDLLVVRPEAEVLVHRLPPGGGAFVAALIAGRTLGEAVATACAESADFDPAQALAGLFRAGAVTGFTTFVIPTKAEIPGGDAPNPGVAADVRDGTPGFQTSRE